MRGARRSGVWFPLVSSRAQKLGPWLVILVINYLIVHSASLWKYVDDTTVSEIVEKGQISFTQQLVNSVEDWASNNRFQLNEKCKELRITLINSVMICPIY